MLSEDLNGAKRRRVARACDVCRRKKVRCDGVQPASDPPSCTNCKIYGHECSFIDAPKKRGPPKGYVEALETRLQRMESVINGLAQTGKLHKSKIHSALVRTNESSRALRKSPSPSPDSQPTSLHDSPYVSGTDEEFSSESNGSQSDMSEGGHLAVDEKGHTRYIGNSSGIFVFKASKKIVVCDEFNSPKERSPDKDIISELPPKKLCDQLLDVYWESFSFYFPIIDRQDFMEKYDNMDANYNHVMLLYAMLAIASKLAEHLDDVTSTSDIDYYDRARGLLRGEFDNSTLSTIQALLLMARHQQSAHDSSSWVFLGLAIRIAQDMGLHRDSSNWNLNERQAEVRRRVWWECVVFDGFLSLALGRPLAVNEEDYDVRYPTAGKLFYDRLDSIEMFIHNIKVSSINSRISKHIYGIKSKRVGGNESILSTLDKELNEWYKNLPSRCQYDRTKKLPDDPMPVYVSLKYYTIQILLHRPYIRCPKSKAPPSSIPSLTICTVAASNITHIIYRLMKRGPFNYKWRHTSYAFFTATTMHIINVLSDDERFREVAKQGLRMSIKFLEYLKSEVKKAEKFLLILSDLLEVKNINLDGPDNKDSSKEALETKEKSSVDDNRFPYLYYKNLKSDDKVDSHDKSLEKPRITFMSSPPVSYGSPQRSEAGGSEMNYEFTPSSESSSFMSPSQFNEFNESFPSNANTFIPETSSLLFDDVSNNYYLSVPNTIDWMEWSNWTEYMIKLQTSRSNP